MLIVYKTDARSKINGSRDYLATDGKKFYTGNTASTAGKFSGDYSVIVKNKKALAELADALEALGLENAGRV